MIRFDTAGASNVGRNSTSAANCVGSPLEVYVAVNELSWSMQNGAGLTLPSAAKRPGRHES